MKNFELGLSKVQFEAVLAVLVKGGGKSSSEQATVNDWVDKMEAGTTGLTVSVNWTRGTWT